MIVFGKHHLSKPISAGMLGVAFERTLCWMQFFLSHYAFFNQFNFFAIFSLHMDEGIAVNEHMVVKNPVGK